MGEINGNKNKCELNNIRELQRDGKSSPTVTIWTIIKVLLYTSWAYIVPQCSVHSPSRFSPRRKQLRTAAGVTGARPSVT